MTNCRAVVLTYTLPSGPVRVEKKPIMNEPTTLTMNVPHGKVSPINRAATPEHQYRAVPPSALPIAIQIYVPMEFVISEFDDWFRLHGRFLPRAECHAAHCCWYAADACCYRHFTTNTGHGASCTIRSARLPIMRSYKAEWPVAPMTSNSILSSAASRTTSR